MGREDRRRRRRCTAPRGRALRLAAAGGRVMAIDERPSAPARTPHESETKFNLLGTPFRRVDGRAKVTGQTRFADDLAFPRMVFMRLKRSTVPHARIKRIDATRAAALPGVLGILTGEAM